MVGSRPRLKVRQPISFIFPCLQNESAKYCILICTQIEINPFTEEVWLSGQSTPLKYCPPILSQVRAPPLSNSFFSYMQKLVSVKASQV